MGYAQINLSSSGNSSPGKFRDGVSQTDFITVISIITLHIGLETFGNRESSISSNVCFQ